MNDDTERWKRFIRTVETATAAALAREDLRALGDDAAVHGASETFLALAASAEGPREHVELRNARRNLSIRLSLGNGGVDVEVAASGFASIREWAGARGLITFEAAGISATLVFDSQGRAAKFLAGADLDALARDAVGLTRI